MLALMHFVPDTSRPKLYSLYEILVFKCEHHYMYMMYRLLVLVIGQWLYKHDEGSAGIF